MQLLTHQLSTHLYLMKFMVEIPKLMDISSSNSIDDYSRSPLDPNNQSKQTICGK